MSGAGEPRKLGDLLAEVLRERGMDEQMARTTALDAWDDAVGEKIAEVTRAVRVDGPVLFVEVRSSAWMMELEMMKREILERLNDGRDGGRIEKLRFRLAEGD